MGSQTFWKRWGPAPWDGAWLVPRNTLLRLRVTMQYSVIQTIRTRENSDPSRRAYQGHSRSLEPTRIDRPPSDLDNFLSVICSNHGPIWSSFRDKKRLLNSHTPMFLTPPLMGFFVEFCNGAAAQKKLEWCPYNTVKVWRIRSDTVGLPALNGRTDGRICYKLNNIARHVIIPLKCLDQ